MEICFHAWLQKDPGGEFLILPFGPSLVVNLSSQTSHKVRNMKVVELFCSYIQEAWSYAITLSVNSMATAKSPG